MLEIDDVPIGTRVKTPTGRVGTVIKHKGDKHFYRHLQRNHDLFPRALILFDGGNPRDTVTLQPHLLELVPSVDRCSSASNPDQMAFVF
jgi:hypothetical protein